MKRVVQLYSDARDQLRRTSIAKKVNYFSLLSLYVRIYDSLFEKKMGENSLLSNKANKAKGCDSETNCALVTTCPASLLFGLFMQTGRHWAMSVGALASLRQVP